MSDEIKKPEVNAEEEKQLDDKALDQVAGADSATTTSSPKLHEAACKGTHIPEVTIE